MRARDAGFTVLELLIAMMIMLLITVPLVASFVIGLQTSLGSQQDVTNSADTQLLGYFFDIDVASAETVATTSTCGGPDTATDDVVLQLTWTDGGTTTVAYRAEDDNARTAELGLATTVKRLNRVVCTASGSPVTVLGRTLLASPVVTCDGTACAAGSSTPRRVSLRVQERSTQQADVGSSTTFTYGVTAARRVTP